MAGWDRYASSFISRRPRVTVSSTSPEEIDSTATIIKPIDSTAVGSRGTMPSSR